METRSDYLHEQALNRAIPQDLHLKWQEVQEENLVKSVALLVDMFMRRTGFFYI